MLSGGSHSPRAAQLQRQREPLDQVLTELARQQHPTVAWWWGVRKHRGTTCAWCYVCNTVIVVGALNVGITEAQQGDIDAHRTEHWQDVRQRQAGAATPRG